MMIPLYLEWGGNRLSFAHVTNVDRTYKKSVSITPKPACPADDAFPLETASTLSITFDFIRVEGDERYVEDDKGQGQTQEKVWVTEACLNSAWLNDLDAALDRWQARTDGFQLTYSPESAAQSSFTYRGYVSELSYRFEGGYADSISGSFTFEVGNMSMKE